ncbi:MAG: ribonuclease HII [Candidatus Staskawiczbacteria bacterium]|nr:ribonuclease HII [Candidatus Staskawiczbacteria bacterium]MBI3337056.1 ribonuclease HII [Candidatus Staskawiczbacteria bacterium]
MNIRRKKISNGVNYPNFNEEKKFWKKGLKLVIGIDEAGRGPLAGPVVAGAVMFKFVKAKHSGVQDSKKLTPKKREEIYNYFKKNPDIEWGIGVVSEKIIDKINILEATKLAMIKAVKDLEKKLVRAETGMQFVLIIDGNMKLNINLVQKSIIKADQKVFSCALASIFAKVTRDEIMQKFHKKYPEYCFDKHKGYGTNHHFKMIKKYGYCKIHRKSFYPIKLF